MAGTIRLTVKQVEALIKGASLTDKATELLSDAVLSGKRHVDIPVSEWEKSQENLKNHLKKKLDFNTLIKLKSVASNYEKSGKFEAAYSNYQKLLEFATSCESISLNNYSHDINRMRIVANKLKRSDEYEEFLYVMDLENPKPKKK